MRLRSLADSGVVTLQYDKGQFGARWAASDENGDDLLHKVEIRGVQESEWRLLKDKVKEKHLSRPLLIDNSPPRTTGPTAARASGRLEVRWKAADAQSLIQWAEYSLDGGDWLVAQPTTRVSDSQEHDYTLSLEGVSSGEHTVAVRVTDDYDNQAVAKAVVRP